MKKDCDKWNKKKNDVFHYGVSTPIGDVCAKLTQVRVIRSRRLSRKVDVLSESEFVRVKESFSKFI
jgi:hypothetical protein